MSNLQIRNVRLELHKKFRERAAHAGMSLSEYLLRELADAGQRPTMDEFLERISSDPKVNMSVNVADIIWEGRDGH